MASEHPGSQNFIVNHFFAIECLYWFEVTNTTASPDGIEKIVSLINGSFPGPTIIADWGDTVIVHLTNSLTNNGSSLHFHGIRQNYTNDQDGVASLTQCPAPPGYTTTYKWRATQYGTSWYHSHFSVQAWNGVFGGILINGPATANYDEDLGHLFLNDWFHATADQMFIRAEYSGPPELDTGLINGTNVYNNSGTVTGSRFEQVVEEGTSYRIRLVNAAIDTHFQFSIDNHTFTVIANDLVPIVPYEATVLNMAMGELDPSLSYTPRGQRYDIILNATQPLSNVTDYWIRAIPGSCSDNANADDIRGILRYDSSSSSTPSTISYITTEATCEDEDSSNLVPYLALDVSDEDYEAELSATVSGSPFRWYLNDTTMIVNWDNPTLYQVYNNDTTFNTSEAVYVLPTEGEWAYVIIEAQAGGAHPIHLHGHDFYVLASGTGTFSTSSATLTTSNPPRRDVALMPSNGYLVIGFPVDNPGAWLMHCHIGWHTGEGFAIQLLEMQSKIRDMIDYDSLNEGCQAWNSFTEDTGIDVTTDESGV
ncbi:MAG: hypothetical protein M1834_000437 [Cirrosporium novae-zelandiae]|nr:MAG: hypothetical protein M1834_000437 [Cirrosporium novae-zelandiae]